VHPLFERLYAEAVELANAEGSVSASFLQREMNLPYNFAEGLLQQMQKRGDVAVEPERRGFW
jgi:DNA segregation ATPase FtsK/SpoIIIE-like protein